LNKSSIECEKFISQQIKQMFLHSLITKQAGGFHPGSLFRQLIGVNIFGLGASTACFFRNAFGLKQPYSKGFAFISGPRESTLAQELTNSNVNNTKDRMQRCRTLIKMMQNSE
jgi:hypothetical protein